MDAIDLKVTDGSASGAWIEPGLGGDFGAVTLQVPNVFEAYARVFHPAYDRVDGSPVSWAEVAAACGTTAHGEMQWHAIVGVPRYEDLEQSKWSGREPSLGDMDIPTLDSLCEILAAHTSDPAHCFFGLCTIQCWEDSFSKAELGGHRLLELPLGRDHIVLEGPLAAVDQIVEEPRPAPHRAFLAFVGEGEEPPNEKEIAKAWKSRGAPNLIWPADRTWLVASEVDFDSTLVGGSAELIDAIVDSPRLEAWKVEATTSLAVDADKVNVF